MLAGALMRAGTVLEDDWALQHGLLTLRRIRGEHDDPTALRHSPGGIGGLLDDQVQVALAAIEAHEATGDAEWLGWAVRSWTRVWDDYLDAGGGGLFDSRPPVGGGPASDPGQAGAGRADAFTQRGRRPLRRPTGGAHGRAALARTP